MYNQQQGTTLTFTQRLHAEEFKEFLANVAAPVCKTKAIPSNKIPLLLKEKGVPITPIYANTNTYSNAVTQRGCLGTDHTPANSNGDVFFTEVTKNILTLEGTYTLRQTIPIINNMIKKAGNNFYGVLLRNTSSSTKILNPLHPLVARALLTSNVYDTTKFKVLVYFYPSRKKMDKKFKTYTTSVAEVSSAVTNLLRLSKINTEVKIDELKIINVEPDKNCLTVKVTKGMRTRNLPVPYAQYSTNAIYYTLPHQLLTRRNIAPYYGTSVLRLSAGRSGECCPVSPYLAANVSNSGGLYKQITFNNVCTGGQPSSTLEGLSTLNHSYLGSPLNRTIIRPGAMLYSDQCIDTSMFLYMKAGYIPDYTPITVEPIEEELFPAAHLEIVKDSDTVTEAYTVLRNTVSSVETFPDAVSYYTDILDYLKTLPREPCTVDCQIPTSPNGDETTTLSIDVTLAPTITTRRYQALLIKSVSNHAVFPITEQDGSFVVTPNMELVSTESKEELISYEKASQYRLYRLAPLVAQYQRDIMEIIQEKRTQYNAHETVGEPGFIRQT